MFNFLRKTLLWIVLAPLVVTWTGIASNQAVLIANNDTFPVRINPVKLYDWTDDGKNIKVIQPYELPRLYPHGLVSIDDVHCLMTPETHLNLLADNFDFHTSIQSIGDLLINLGEWSNQFAPILWFGAVIAKLARREDFEGRP